MAKTRSASLLEDLESLSDEQLKTARDTIDATIRFRKVPTSSLFTPASNSPYEKNATELLLQVKKADYNAIKKVLDINPEFMFIQVKDTANKVTSPLQKAFELYDTYTWKMLYEKIKDKPELVKKFTEQAHQQQDHINLKPLFDAYTEYDTVYRDSIIYGSKRYFDRELNDAWHQVGIKQRELLPAHMLRELCREGKSWSTTSTFDTNQVSMPTGGRICLYPGNHFLNIDDEAFSSGVGVSFSLVRGTRSQVGGCKFPRGGMFCNKWFARTSDRPSHVDAEIISRLFKTRRDDLAKQISELELSPEQGSRYKK